MQLEQRERMNKTSNLATPAQPQDNQNIPNLLLDMSPPLEKSVGGEE